MGMLLNSKEPINGVEPKLAKQISNACRLGWDCPERIAAIAKRDIVEVKKALLPLEEAGFLQSKTENSETLWMCTESGMNDLAMARFGKSMNRAEAESLLQKSLKRIREYNSIEEFPFSIEEARVFGSYLKDVDSLGDLDLWIIVAEKEPYKNKLNWKLNYHGRNGEMGNLSIIDQLLFPENELCRFLLQRNRKVSIHLQDMSEFTQNWITVYRKADD